MVFHDDSGDGGRITVMACYDTPTSARHAMDLINRLNRRSDLPARLDVRLWRWDVLDCPEVGEDLARDVRAADLMLIVHAGVGGASEALLKLVGDWATTHRWTEAAILVLRPGLHGPGPLARVLNQLVESHGLSILGGATSSQPGESDRLAA